MQTQRPDPGFSLIELLVTVALIAILSAMLYNFGSGRHERNARERCADNLQKIYLALQIYANDDRGRLPFVTNAQTAEQPLTLLVPHYSADTSIFICPGGRDPDLPSGEPLTQNKISYAYYMGRSLKPAADGAAVVLLSDRQVNTDPKRAGEFVFSPDGRPPGNNHHKFGGNFLLMDGSVRPSGPLLNFTLGIPSGVVLLNPKP